MTLKKRISITISFIFSMLYAFSALIIFWSFSTFRREEFVDRLEEKAFNTTKLLLEVKEVDNTILKLIDQNSIHKLLNEKILIFDHQFKLIYSSLDDSTIGWNEQQLKELKTKKKIYRVKGAQEVVGLFYTHQEKDYYTLIAAEDIYGNSKLNFLKEVLLILFILGTALVWLSTYYFIRKLLFPLDLFQKQITTMSLGDELILMDERSQNDELTLLTKAFNQMMRRIQHSYNAQREFTSNASHELRTPISRLILQLDNVLPQVHQPEITKKYLQNMSNDLNQLSELISSLLILARLNTASLPNDWQPERIDELVFDAFDTLKSNFPEFSMHFNLQDTPDLPLEYPAIKPLLDIVFINLFRNAYLYSPDRKVHVQMNKTPGHFLEVIIENQGQDPLGMTEDALFKPFVRGQNAANINGSGLGLHIVKRILDYHQVHIHYSFSNGNHTFTLNFTQHKNH
ncbi:MAG: two-component sensor histidine kinase [Flavobacterium sp. BFFFF2]|nr:MAG: two-component sensor histidine kinase [Flavobacterium sp. BFFFF2]